MDQNLLTVLLKTPWEVDKSIYDFMDTDTEMFIKPKDNDKELIGINIFKALKDIYVQLRDNKEEGMRWLDELGRMVMIATLEPSNAKTFVHETMIEEHMRNLDDELKKLGADNA